MPVRVNARRAKMAEPAKKREDELAERLKRMKKRQRH